MVNSSNDLLRIDAKQFDRAQQTLGQAFYDYNLMVHAAPTAKRRAPGVTALYGAILWDCLRHGEAYSTAEGDGVACWLPPETPNPTLWRQIHAGMLRLPFYFGITGFRLLLAYDAVAQKLHHQYAPQPHWYLSAIGVKPDRQGQGLGGALMLPILARADARALPCYLETHRESNVRLYEKHGFTVVCRAEVPEHSLPIWAMLREPSAARVS